MENIHFENAVIAGISRVYPGAVVDVANYGPMNYRMCIQVKRIGHKLTIHWMENCLGDGPSFVQSAQLIRAIEAAEKEDASKEA